MKNNEREITRSQTQICKLSAARNRNPLCYLALGALFGIGMVRKVPVWVNLSLSSLVLFVPPLALSISSAFRSQLLGLGYAVWALLILYCFPMYFPNERVLAMRNGLSMLGLDGGLAIKLSVSFQDLEMAESHCSWPRCPRPKQSSSQSSKKHHQRAI